jgi:hypothetical protein
VESALYVKKKWGTIYRAKEMWYGRKGCEGLQKEGSRCDQLIKWMGITICSANFGRTQPLNPRTFFKL